MEDLAFFHTKGLKIKKTQFWIFLFLYMCLIHPFYFSFPVWDLDNLPTKK
jgi:hypothetical protein